MSEKTSGRPHHSIPFGTAENGVVTISDEWQAYIDTLDFSINLFLGDSLILEKYTVATVPPAEDNALGIIGITDEVGGQTPAWSNGTDWLRFSDGAVITT
jgi:hypothetical protein